MLKRFQSFAEAHAPGIKNGLSLLAVSGGADSVAMAWLFHLSGWRFEVLHVNYGLRGTESREDEDFVRMLCAGWNVPCHVIRPDTLAVAQSAGESVQMAARRIRYDFFRERMQASGAIALCTAHQQTDNLEHLFIYLLRNSPAAFRGIPVVADTLFRPLMFTNRAEIRQWMKEQGYTWREDRSNLEADYLRNKVRHWLLPAVHEAYAVAEDDFYELSRQVETVHRRSKERVFQNVQRVAKESGNGLLFETGKHDKELRAYLRLLNMNPVQSEKLLRPAVTGSVFRFGNYLAEVRNTGIWVGREAEIPDYGFFIGSASELPVLVCAGKFEVEVNMEKVPENPAGDGQVWNFDLAGIEFPVCIRPRRKGERMQPFGMKGTRKISDVMVDARIPNMEKPGYPVMADANGVLGIIGLRRAEVARITHVSKKVISVRWKRTDSGITT